MAGNTTSVQTASLLSIIEQGQRMESLFVNVLLESAMKLSSITDVNIFVMVDTAYGRKWAGRKGLRDEFMKGNIRRDSHDEEICAETMVPGGVAYEQKQQQHQHQATPSVSGAATRPSTPPAAAPTTAPYRRDHSPSAVFGLNTLATAASVLNGQYAPPLPASFTSSPLMLAHLQQSAAAAYPVSTSPHSYPQSARSSPSRPHSASSVPKRVRDIPSSRSQVTSSLSRQHSSPLPVASQPNHERQHLPHDQPKSMKTSTSVPMSSGIAATASSGHSPSSASTSPNENIILQSADLAHPVRTRSPLVGSQKRKRRPSFSSVLNVQAQQTTTTDANFNKSPRVVDDVSRHKPNLDIVKTRDNGTEVYVVKKTAHVAEAPLQNQGGAINLSTKTTSEEAELDEPGALVIAEEASLPSAAITREEPASGDHRYHGSFATNEALLHPFRARAAEAGDASLSDGEETASYESIYSGGTLDYSAAITAFKPGVNSPSKGSGGDGFHVRVTQPGSAKKKITLTTPSSPESPQSPIDQAEIMKLVMQGIPEPGGGFSCHICNLKVGNRNRLKQHIESVHLQLRLFECPDCHRRFNRKDNLQSHMKAGHGAPRFNCPECKSVYRYEHDLKKHYQKKHAAGGDGEMLLALQAPTASESSVDHPDDGNYALELEYDSNSTTSGSPAPPPFREEISMNMTGTPIST